MILNACEFMAMNNPLRAAVQHYFEARCFLKMIDQTPARCALEIGCGRGVGVELIFDRFGATTVDAFDLDPKMIELAGKRLKSRPGRINLWIGDATYIAVPDSTYDTVFDFGIIHHIPEWRQAISEVFRILKPGGRFYTEEVFQNFIAHPLCRRLFDHPRHDRFNHNQYKFTLSQTGFIVKAWDVLWKSVGWYIADKPV